MTVRFLSICLGLLLAGPPAARAASPFSLADLQPGRMTMQGHYDDDKTTATYTVREDTCEGKACWHILWDSSIKRIEAWVFRDGRPIRTVYDKPKKKEQVEISYTEAGATYRYRKGGKTETTTVEKPGMLEALVIDVLLLAFPFEKPRELVFPIIDADSDDGDSYTMYTELDEVEEVTVLGKKEKAYKIEAGIKGFVGLFAPTFYFWYSVSEPHRYLRYQGPDEAFDLTEGQLAIGPPH